MVTESIVLNEFFKHGTMEQVVKNISQEHLDFICDFLGIPFELENERDKEWIIFLYIVDTLKWFVDNASDDESAMNCAYGLLMLLDTTFDHKPEYRVERFEVA